MSAKDIKIDAFKLQDCNGNLNALRGNWAAAPKLTELASDNVGSTAERLREYRMQANTLTTSLDTLLSNSVGFFQRVGITFVEADKKAEDNLNTIVT